MARIPRNIAGKVSPSLIKVNYDTTPQNVGGDVANALVEQASVIGAKMQEFAAKQQRAEELNYSINSSLQFQNQALQSFEEAKKAYAGTDGKGFTQNLMSQFDNYAEQILQQAPSQEAQLRMKAKLGSFKLQMQGQAYKYETGLAQDFAIRNTDKTVNSFVNLVMQNPDEFDKAQVQLEDTFNILDKNGIDTTRMRAKAAQDLLRSKVIGEMERDPVKTYADLLEGKYNELNNGSLINLIGQAGKKQSQLFQLELKKQEETISRMLVDSGVPLDPKNKEHVKTLDTIYKERLIQHGSDLKSSLNFSLDFLKAHNSILPPTLRSSIEANLRAGTPESKAGYAKLIMELNNNPNTSHLVNDLKSDTVKKAAAITRFLDGGIDPNTAVTKAEEMLKPIQEDVKRTRLEIMKRDQLNDIDTILSEIGDEFGTDVGVELPAEDFKKAFEEAYIQTGDEELATTIARKEVRRKFAVTDVNGEEEIMKNAPEVLFPGFVDDFKKKFQEVIDNEFKKKEEKILTPGFSGLDQETLKKLGNEDLGNIPGMHPNLKGETINSLKETVTTGEVPEGLKIESDARTPTDGSYLITHTNEFGVQVPLIDKKTGNVLRFKYTPGADEETKKVLEEVDLAKKERERLNELAKKAEEKSKEEAQKLAEKKNMSHTEKRSLLKMLGSLFSF